MLAPRSCFLSSSLRPWIAGALISGALSAQAPSVRRLPASEQVPSAREARAERWDPWSFAMDQLRRLETLTGATSQTGAAAALRAFAAPPSFERVGERALRRPLVEIETVPVGNPGNPGDPRGGFGAVPYTFAIGKHEVTAGIYTVFLNAVAASDPHGLYNPKMATHARGCGIQRAGASGSFTYSVAPDQADRPVNFVSWGDGARFANWLHNGQPRGPQEATTTEDGAYALHGALGGALDPIEREPGAVWGIPTEDEWYKAAFHQNDGVTASYFSYPTGTEAFPSNQLVAGGQNSATYFTTVFTIGAPYYRTEVGAHSSSPSPYGTFDQGGNVQEWNDTIVEVGSRGLRGGSFAWGISELFAESRTVFFHSDDEFDDIGFRVVRLR
jgi:formylglycine-generating enzyme required for sulfatase activity